MDVPETRYADSGGVAIAYQVVSEGPFDVVWIPGSTSNVELLWQEEARARFFRRLASFCRLIVFDKRGTGVSDRVSEVADLETRMDDVRAVMDAAGSERAAVIGVSEGGPMSALFAATYPERTRALVLYGTLPRFTRAPDFPWSPSRSEVQRENEDESRRWGTLELAAEWQRAENPDSTDDEIAARASHMRQSASPGAFRMLMEMNLDIDVRAVLPSIRVPTLVVHRSEDHIPVDGARWMARQIPGARFVELPGGPHMAIFGDWEAVVQTIEDFVVPLGVEEPDREPDRVLATVLFTDVVGSTARAAELGDRAWRQLLEQHHARIRQQLSRYRGTEIDTAGDGFFASFDGPARAIRCATAITETMRDLGLDVRAGLHAGECELLDGKVGGIAVHIGARVASQAAAGEVLVSQTVKDLVVGSELRFREQGVVDLKGVPGEWRLYAVEPSG